MQNDLLYHVLPFLVPKHRGRVYWHMCNRCKSKVILRIAPGGESFSRQATCTAQAVFVGDQVLTWVPSPHISSPLLSQLPQIFVLNSPDPTVRTCVLDRRCLTQSPVIPSQLTQGWVITENSSSSTTRSLLIPYTSPSPIATLPSLPFPYPPTWTSTSIFQWVTNINTIIITGTSLVAQWLRICLPMQGTRVREDPTCRGATKPVRQNYRACTLEPTSHIYWACVPQLLKPARWEPVLHNKRSHCNEKPVHHNEE